MGSLSTMESVVSEKLLGLATTEIREAFDNITLEKEYLNTAQVIIQYLEKCLKAASITQNEEEETQEVANIMYVLKRLMKALSSDRNFSRHGGYTILYSLLKNHPNFLPHVLTSIKFFYEGKDKGEHSFIGYTLAHGALIKSGHAEQDSELVDIILEQFLQVRLRASYMDPVVAQFIINLIMSKNKNIVSQIYDRLQVPISKELNELNMTTMWIRIVLSRPEFQEYLHSQQSFTSKLYCFESYEFIHGQLWNWHASEINIFPFLQDLIESLLLHSGDKSGADNLTEFFALTIIPSYKKYDSKHPAAASFKRFRFIVSITQMFFPHLKNGNQVSAVFVGFLVRQIIKYCVSDDPIIKTYAYGFCESIAEAIENNMHNGEVQLAYLSQIINHPGSVRFDKVTGTGLVRASYKFLHPDCIKGLSTLLISNIQNDKYEVSEGMKGQLLFSGDFLMSAEILSQIVQHPAMADSKFTVWRAEQVFCFFKNVFFRKHPEKEMEILIKMYKKCLDTFSKRLEDQITFVDVIVTKIDGHMVKKSKKSPLSSEALKARVKVGETIKKLKDKHGDDKEFAVFRLLFGLLSLHLFIDTKSTLDMISDIDHCYKEAQEAKQKANKKKGKGVKNDCGFKQEEEWVKVFVDVMLLLLSRGDHYWRNVVNSIFRVQCHLLGPSSLTLLTDVIDPDKEEDVFKQEDEELKEEDEDSDTSDEEEEEEGKENEDGKSEESDESEDDSDEEEDDIDLPDTEEKLLLKMQMQKVIGIGMNDIDMDEMSDAEMKRVDTSLGALFAQYQKLNKRTKPKLKIDKELLLQFRMRVCDLFAGLIIVSPSVNHMIALISPLLRVLDWSLRDKLQKSLCNRVKSLISDLCKTKDFKMEEHVDIQDIVASMENVFEICIRTPTDMNTQLQICYTFLVKHGLRTLGEKSDDTNNDITKTYVKHLERIVTTKKWIRHYDVFSGPLSLESGSLLMSFRTLSELGFNSKCKSAVLFVWLKTLWMNRNSLSRMPHAEVKTLQEETSKRITEFFIGCQDVKHLQAKRAIAMFDLVQEIFKFHNHCPGMTAGFDWTSVIQSIKGLFRHVTRASHPGIYKKIINLSNFMKIDLKSLDKVGETTKSRKEILLAKRKQEEEKRQERKERKDKKRKKNVEKKTNGTSEVDESEDIEENGEEDTEEPATKKSKSDDEYKEKKKKRKEEKRRRKREIADNRVNKLKEIGEVDTLEHFSFAKFDNLNDDE